MQQESSAPRKINKEKKDRKPVLTFILILLILQVAMSGYQLYLSIRSEMDRTQLTESVANYTNNVDNLINNMLSDFKADVYNNPNVNSTAKQAVMASEYNFNAAMLIIKQNNRLLELITQTR